VIELVVHESPTAQGSLAEEQQQPKDHDVGDKANEEYPPPSDTEDEKMYCDADEVESFGSKAPVLTGRLRALLEHLGITTAPRYRIKEVPRPGRVKFKAIAEIFFRSRVLCRHKGLAFRASHSDVVADTAWQAITSWVRSNKSRLQNSIHHLLPYRKKDQFKAYGVKNVGINRRLLLGSTVGFCWDRPSALAGIDRRLLLGLTASCKVSSANGNCTRRFGAAERCTFLVFLIAI
jgi:hypothetical protein